MLLSSGPATLTLALGCDAWSAQGPGADQCFDVCGDGTRCVDRRCVVAPPDEAPPDEADPRKPTKRRRRSTKGGAAAADGDFKPIDDSHIPKYDPHRVQEIDMKSGTERLADHVIRAHLRQLEPKFNQCIETAAMHSADEIRPGGVDFVFSIESTGKVSGINVKAPNHLRVFGIVPCLRKAVYDHRFPSYDGPPTGVDYSFKVG